MYSTGLSNALNNNRGHIIEQIIQQRPEFGLQKGQQLLHQDQIIRLKDSVVTNLR